MYIVEIKHLIYSILIYSYLTDFFVHATNPLSFRMWNSILAQPTVNIVIVELAKPTAVILMLQHIQIF